MLNPWLSEYRYAWIKEFDIYASETSRDVNQMQMVGSFRLDHVGIDQAFHFDPTPARYVALVVNSHYGGAEGVTLNEFEVYGEPAGAVEPVAPDETVVDNIAAAGNGGRIVAFSSQDPTGVWPVSALIDGRNDTPEGWSTDPDSDADPYVVFAFRGDRPYVIDRVVLNPHSDGYEEDWVQEFEVWGSEVSPEPGQMTFIAGGTLQQIGEDQFVTFAPTTVRYLLLAPLSNFGGGAFALNEFEVYGTLAGERGAPADRRAAVATDVRPGAAPPIVPTAEGAGFTGPAVHRMGETVPSVENIDVVVLCYDIVPVIYHLYGTYLESMTTTTVTNRNAGPITLRVEASVANYTETDVKTITLASGETYTVKQNPPLLPTALGELHEQRKGSVRVLVEMLKEGERRLLFEDTVAIEVYSRDDFPWNIPGFYNGTQFLATMVTPNDPAIEEMMRKAAPRMPGGIVTWDYKTEDDSDHRTWDRMKAIYDTLAEDYDIIYVATGVTFVPKEDMSEGFSLQRLQLPYEVMDSHGGMCVELSLLFASAFEKLFWRPIIITIPGHVYVAIPISWNSNTYYFLEATMIGGATFEEAVQYGNKEFMEEHIGPIDEDRLDHYFWLDVSEARAEGITPIPWRR